MENNKLPKQGLRHKNLIIHRVYNSKLSSCRVNSDIIFAPSKNRKPKSIQINRSKRNYFTIQSKLEFTIQSKLEHATYNI